MQEGPDPFDLARFLKAQEPVYADVLAELGAGRKASHWMWFIFPQIHGLGHSYMAAKYAISGEKEARAYLAHPVLGERLRHCSALVLAVQGKSIHAILGSPDDVKFGSSMTLFSRVARDAQPVFRQCLEKYFEGREDELTLARL